jgi:hypothetical protein
MHGVRTTAWLPARVWAALASVALAATFVLPGGGSQELNDAEARLGIAAGEQIGPFGQLYGGLEPSVWPGQVCVSQVWAWLENSRPGTSAVRWPSALAAIAVGLLLARRASQTLGPRAGVFVGLCLFSSLAFLDRSDAVGIPWISAVGTIAALDRVLSKGSDWTAGLWGGLAFLCGGWPAVAMVLLPIIVIRRAESSFSPRLLLPILAAFAGWSAWALALEPTAAWGAALTLPLTQGLDWGLLPAAAILALPGTPFALLVCARSVRAGWTGTGRRFVLDWLKVAGAGLLVGTLVPGITGSARVAIVAALAIAAGAGLDRAWAQGATRQVQRAVVGIGLLLVLVWALWIVPAGGYIAATVSYYRQLASVLVALALGLGIVAIEAVRRVNSRWVLGGVLGVAISLKLFHCGFYVPEHNYRLGQGPWGRAIGQWVVPNWPLYIFDAWRADLMLATGHPVRLLANPAVLEFKCKTQPAYVLLLQAEFEHWPQSAPRLIRVREFEDESGRVRVLARTEGDLRLRRGPEAE